MNSDYLDLTVRVGCNLVYETSLFTPISYLLRPRRDRGCLVLQESCDYGPYLNPYEFHDSHGNVTCRSMLVPGRNVINMDALVAVSSLPDKHEQVLNSLPVNELPQELLRYTLPSRYCDSDTLSNFAWQQFGHINNGMQRVHAICDWVHDNIEYRYGSGSPDLTAFDVLQRGYGVCRDFAHLVVALCRAFNLPTRYVTGHLPDIGYFDNGTPMDFHAYGEVYLGEWFTIDARFNVPRIGRIKLGHGMDAVDGAFSTIYGPATLSHFMVWAYQVPPNTVSVGDPVDLSKRIDGTVELRIS
ncbi:transglutaminase family protein [Phragmitibacter flavus]|uniref:Transglutaminase family protein n=1 Tax=Phragmitibacter flavus TaxID=2576071 RepID=A0A5R8KAP8_9BACT|nr:transglutaminase family protein [Phragmitibacter flavus]TLD69388.1 transglutaminase family protein [Phragmitibacter flavus]